MVSKIFKKSAFIIVTALLLSGCTDKADKNADKNIVRATVTDENGVSLNIIFDNAKDTANLTLPDNTTILLKGVAMASGIKYANDEYEYSEWHGESELKRGDEIIFKTQK
ncbi:MAG: MliC family protein [Campylobacteraceae bacterium]|jgi:membrane-bound inhibitor of C-type lysozyme|nr:MliC family protein [Campylobacteraceae bacterium]